MLPPPSVGPICSQRRFNWYVAVNSVRSTPRINWSMTVPAIIYIDKWGRRPMLLAGTLLMGFWLYLVGGLQGRFGNWGSVDGNRMFLVVLSRTPWPPWQRFGLFRIMTLQRKLSLFVLTFSYAGMLIPTCVWVTRIDEFDSFAITMGPVSWTYPAELVRTTQFRNDLHCTEAEP